MPRSLYLVIIGLCLNCSHAFGWGKLAHHVVARNAAKLVKFHPFVLSQKARYRSENNSAKLKAIESLSRLFENGWLEMGLIGTIPDLYWSKIKEKEYTTHFFRPDLYTEIPSPDSFFKLKVPLNVQVNRELYKKKKRTEPFEDIVGTLPWRIQQFTQLYSVTLKKYPKSCKTIKANPHPSAQLIAYAGLLAHYVAEATHPQLITSHYTGDRVGQSGLEDYFGNRLVNAVEWKLDQNVFGRALKLFNSDQKFASSVVKIHKVARDSYPKMGDQNRTTALMLSLMADSYNQGPGILDLDKRFAIASFGEARLISECAKFPQIAKIKKEWKTLSKEEREKFSTTRVHSTSLSPSCRRSPRQSVSNSGQPAPAGMGATVASHFDEVIIDRLAIASALAADLAVGLWFENGMPQLCPTHTTFIKPAYISPSDSNCFGYLSPKKKSTKLNCLKNG